MFTYPTLSINTIPRQYFYAGAGIAVIFGLLVGIASVASGEVKKAQARESLLASQKSAMTYCVENLRGPAFNACMQQARAEMYNDGSRTSVADIAKSGAVLAGGPLIAPSDSQSLMPASFSTVR
ncbi:hypothetical protein [Polaromonas sp. A23]|uniref:hypothetical protein n=1 Tax=Polaromonas sp. A23 TaxID=1944133 RepID=UPI0009860FE5|nr:hypothetical protein [Polaromonas sp. A23]OOG36687.1 hypothetical protein B0B52_20545 [Polaromonas sp. A23]